MEQVYRFFVENTPPPGVIVKGGPAFVAWAYLSLRLSARLKCARGVKTGYTRKTFHVLTFLSAVGVQLAWGLPVLCLYGAAVSCVLAYAVARGAGHPLYEALAREQDAPHRTYYVVVPYFATLVGGVLSNVLFGHAAIIGYLVGGLGDAAGEPVGTRWGRHRYRVPSFGGVRVTRSVEGSAGVMLFSLVAILVGVGLSPELQLTTRTAWLLLPLAACCALLEAASPHGWDNASLQLVPSFMAATLL